MQVVREGELELCLPDGVTVTRLDPQTPGQPQPSGMSLVDFVLEAPAYALLLEFKDPGASGATAAARQSFLAEVKGGDWIPGKIVPKMRDSYTFQHLIGHDTRRLVAVLVVGWDCFAADRALLLALQDRLRAGVRGETGTDWVRQYVTGALVLTVDTWNERFPEYPLSRRLT